jgi:hypothetical protein
MKQLILIFFPGCFLLTAITGCNNAQGDAVKQAEAIQETVKNSSPGTIPTSENGYYMTAKIDGKEWSASYMMPYSNSGSYLYIAGENGGDDINFQLWKNGLDVGKRIPFNESHAANLTLKDVPAFFGGNSGEVEITKITNQWMEGTFQFSASSSSSDKKIAVTEGRFRVAVAAGLK